MEKPTYYAVIPANVRYDNRLSGGAKLLYGEITTLSNKTGYSWASNEHFASLYEVHHDTVGEWIKELLNAGHISISGKTTARRIHLAVKAPPNIRRKDPQTSGENTVHNNTREYNKIITDTDSTVGADVNEIISLFKDVNPTGYSKFFARPPQRKAIERLLLRFPRPQLDNIIKVLPRTNTIRYAPSIHSPLELEDKIGKLESFIKREGSGGGITIL